MASKRTPLDKALEALLTSERIATVRRSAFDTLPLPMRTVVRRAVQREPLFMRQPRKVSVIIPVYNVEQYLAECLRSIVNQSYSNLEIIIVDDGSSDNSPAIAETFARKDQRIKLIKQPNAGLGAARNTGLKYTTGDFIVFADSDDVIPPNAYRSMLQTLELTGSDFVVGTYFRMTETSEYVPQWLWDVHEDERLAINADDFTEGLANVFAWNKMFRADFIRRIDLQFPVGVRYEDQLPITRAYLLAESFDIIPELVYKWRIRFDGSSITQNKQAIEDVRDRAKVITEVHDFLQANAPRPFFDAWVVKVLDMDLIPYMAEALHANEEYRQEVKSILELVAGHLSSETREKIDVRTRVALYCFHEGTNEELGHVLLTHQELGRHLPTRVDADGTVRFAPVYPEAVRLEFPPDLFILGEVELATEHGLNRVNWSADSLEISGWAMLRHIDLNETDAPKVALYWQSLDGKHRLDFHLHPAHDFVSRRYGSKWPDYDAAAFHATLDSAKLAAFASAHGELELRATLDSVGRHREFSVSRIFSGGTAVLLRSAVTQDGTLLSLAVPRGEGLHLSVSPVDFVVDAVEFEGADPKISMKVRRGDSEYYQWEERAVSAKTFSSVRRRLLGSPIHVLDSALPGAIQQAGSASLVRTEVATLELRKKARTAIKHVGIEGRILTVTGEVPGDKRHGLRLFLVSKQHQIEAASINFSGSTFEARFVMEIDEFGHTRIAPYGSYALKVHLSGNKRPSPVFPDSSLLDQFPLEIAGRTYRTTFTFSKEQQFYVNTAFPSSDSETGSLGQARLQRWHRTAELEPIHNSVFFQSYLGEQATDSALALHKELHRRFPEMKLYWGVVDETVELPEGAIPVVRYTRDWYEKISRAEYLVNNIYFFNWFLKRPFQTYLQTWHGTPLKKIGRSYWEDRKREPIWIDRMDAQADSWDFLVAPNEFCAVKFAEEFRYKGKILKTGYPRNDVLSTASSDVQNRIRNRIGISTDKKVVLYAPTWRDNKSAQAWVADFVMLLDLQKLAKELGDEYVILVRGHGHNARAGSTVGSKGQVIDVTFYPEVNDLYLVADLTITDYSSVMFDFAITRKPLLFFVPDLAIYADGVRGFYFDYKSLVPGPVLKKQDEVAPAIRSVLAPDWKPSRRYQDFLEEFAELEDGHATERVVDAVWGPSTRVVI